MKRGEIMDHPQQVEITCPDESTLRAWENMCSQVLHELQEGAEIPDALIDSIAELAAMLRSWRSMDRLPLLNISSSLQNA
jgi:hypothetical protein